MDTVLLDDFFKGDTRALARVITRVENRSEDSLEILRKLFPKTGKSLVIGVTGSPGVGKSSLVDRLAAAYRQQNKDIGIDCRTDITPIVSRAPAQRLKACPPVERRGADIVGRHFQQELGQWQDPDSFLKV